MNWSQALQKFPEFTRDELPPMPDGFTDNSWHNDTCPCAIRPIGGAYYLVLWVEKKNPAEREYSCAKRYCLTVVTFHSNFAEVVMESDSWADIVSALSPMTLDDTLTRPISSVFDVWRFCQGLHANNSMFHFDDSPETICDDESNEALFTALQVTHVNERLNEAYALPYWNRESCPIGIALEANENKRK